MVNKLITQVILIATSLAIIFTFIRPAFGEIKETQDELEQYNTTLAHAEALNARLRELIQTEQSFSQSELQALERFLPSSIDEISVMDDIQSIFNQSNVTLTSLTAGEVIKTTDDVVFDGEYVESATGVDSRDFNLVFEGSYDDMKEVLRALEVNSYLLEVVLLEFTVASNSEIKDSGIDERGNITFKMSLRTYGLTGVTN